MKKEFTIRPSPVVTILMLLLAACVIGYCLCSFFAFADLRSEEQKEIDYREELIGNALFKEAQTILKKHFPGPKRATISRISCMRVRISDDVDNLILVETKDPNISYCYRTVYGDFYTIVSDTSYNSFKFGGYKVYSELILEGEDLKILFEETERT